MKFDVLSRRNRVSHLFEKHGFRCMKRRDKSDEFVHHNGLVMYFFWKQGEWVDLAIDPSFPYAPLLEADLVKLARTTMGNGLRAGTSMSLFHNDFGGIRAEHKNSKIGRLINVHESALGTFLSAMLRSANSFESPAPEASSYAFAESSSCGSLHSEPAVEKNINETSEIEALLYETNPELRSIIEKYAVKIASTYYRTEGFRITELGKPFDLLCEKADLVIHVEVKGSRSNLEKVVLTVNEVLDAENMSWRSDLLVVDNIAVEEKDGILRCAGGRARIFESWMPDRNDLETIQFRYSLPSTHRELLLSNLKN